MKELLEKILENTSRQVELLGEIAEALKKRPDPAVLKGMGPLGPGEFKTPMHVEDIKKAMEAVRPAPKDTKLIPEAPAVPADRPLVHAGMPEFEQLKTLLHSDLWPEAADSKLICGDKSDEDKFDRAEGILDLFVDAHLEGLKVLDFGCGEGHLAVKALEQKPKVVVGYDVNPQWQTHGQINSLTFTDNWDVVKEQGPYNVIVIYDVLDHINNDNGGVIEALRRIRQVTAPGCKVFVQTHPFCGRTGGHVYGQINKAFAHLVFTEAELREMGYAPTFFTRRVIHPLGNYQDWFNAANFQIKQTQVSKEPVEAFFSDTPLVTRRIKANWRDSRDPNLREGRHFPQMQMEQHFINYVLG